MRRRCAICNKVITENFYICLNCVKTYSLPYKYRNWPEWVKTLVRIERRALRNARRTSHYLSYERISRAEDSIVKVF